jgi:predicted flap endonuclease-1-like 5' DNA nuclease
MPKKDKKMKKIAARIQGSLSKKFVKSKSYRGLQDRVKVLEKEVAELRQQLSGESATDDAAPEKADSSALNVDSSEQKDDLQRIKGIGAVLQKRLNAIGVNSFKQIAAWREAEIDAFSQQLSFKGRIEREAWVEQARVLAAD